MLKVINAVHASPQHDADRCQKIESNNRCKGHTEKCDDCGFEAGQVFLIRARMFIYG